MAENNYTAKTAIEQLEACGFECEAGPLTNNTAFAWLKEASGSGLVVDWRPRETLPRDATVLITVVATAANRAFYGRPAAVHPAYADENGRLCDCGSWSPCTEFESEFWRTVAWAPLPGPACTAIRQAEGEA